ncbi:MAG: metal-dependent hydrolase, partial [Acidobacteriota bacterium]|nr:metal-dependent hydrolase [Acidobacteriota bacterium]
MDNLTHSLVGLFLARAGFKDATPRGTAIMVVAANAPDFDALSWLFGNATYLHYHRNITHSLIAIPLMAILAVAVVRLLGRRGVRWLPAFGIAIVGVISHIVLDLTNVYGVRLLLPFSGHWYHWDITPVIDVAIWAILLLGVAAPALGRLVGSEIGVRSRDAGNAGWAVVALLLFGAYDYGRGIAHDRAVAAMDSTTYNNLAPRRTGAFPSQNPLKWTGIAELYNAFVEVPVDLRDGFHPAQDSETFYKAARTPAVDAALASLPFQRMLEFVQWPLWVVEPAPDPDRGTRVVLLDLRFGTPRRAGFA